MKICIVTPAVKRGDGQGRANYEVVQEALRRGYQITIVSSKVDPDLAQIPSVEWIPIISEKIPLQLFREMIFSQRSSRWVDQHRKEFDIVQVSGAVTATPGDINTIHFVHSEWLNSPVHTFRARKDIYGLYHWLYTCLNSRWERKALAQAKLVVAVSNRVADELQNIEVPREKIEVIYNGVDVEEFVRCSQPSRQELGLPPAVKLALFAGDLRTPRKNLDTVLKAVAQVPDLHLAIAGDTAKSPYPKLADSLDIMDRVHFLGFRKDLAQIMQAVDCFVFPTRYEPFGMVITEAMAAQLPVITSNLAGAAELITPEAGFVMKNCEDSGELALYLRQICKNPAHMKQMGQVARAIVLDHSWKSKAGHYLDIFENFVKHKNTTSDIKRKPVNI